MKKRNCTISVAKAKALIFTFVFKYAKSRFSHGMAHMSPTLDFLFVLQFYKSLEESALSLSRRELILKYTKVQRVSIISLEFIKKGANPKVYQSAARKYYQP